MKKWLNYTKKLIEYNVNENERVRSYLLVSNNNDGKKMPGIIAIHQHHEQWEIGKSEVLSLTNITMYSYGLYLVNPCMENTYTTTENDEKNIIFC